MKIFAEISELAWVFEQPEKDSRTLLDDEGIEIPYSFTRLGNNRFALIYEGTSHLLHIIKENGIYHVHLDGEYFPVSVEDQRIRELKALVGAARENQGEENILAPIPGLITDIKVQEGDQVEPGDSLIILEAMKMENEIRSDNTGVIQKILIKQGDSVDKDQALLILA